MEVNWRTPPKRKVRRWRLNLQILKEKEFIEKITGELRLFFNENKKQHTSITNLWDTMKAYIRGTTIAYNAQKNKEKWKAHNTLQEEIRNMEKKFQSSPGYKIVKEKLTLLRHKMNILDQEETAKKLKTI